MWRAFGRRPSVGTFLGVGFFSILLCALCVLPGCEGSGQGQVSGTLFLRGCSSLDPTMPGSSDVPNPLPPYSFDPQYFFAEVEQAIQPGLGSTDPRTVSTMNIRLQRTSGTPDAADYLDLLVYDIDRFPSIQAAALAQGQQGVPITPPDLSGMSVPLPGDPAATVRASLSLNVTCVYPEVAPLLHGYIHFTSFGTNLGDQIAAEFSVTIEDARAAREQGNPPPAPDAAGALTGWFSFPLAAGPLEPDI